MYSKITRRLHTNWKRPLQDNIYVTKNNNMNYKVKIKYFSDKVYTNTDIQTILHEVAIFTDIEDIISIIKVTNVN